MAGIQAQMDIIKRTCADNGNKCSADLEQIRANLALAEEARQKDHIKINRIGKDLSKTNYNLDTTNSTIADQASKLQLVDNVSNKNKETIARLEERLQKLEQQQSPKETGARPKVPTTPTPKASPKVPQPMGKPKLSTVIQAATAKITVPKPKEKTIEPKPKEKASAPTSNEKTKPMDQGPATYASKTKEGNMDPPPTVFRSWDIRYPELRHQKPLAQKELQQIGQNSGASSRGASGPNSLASSRSNSTTSLLSLPSMDPANNNNSNEGSTKVEHPMATARRTIGFWQVRLDHITFFTNKSTRKEDIRHFPEARKEAAHEFLDKELKWTNPETINSTKWSADKEILWVEFAHEQVVQDLFRRQAKLHRNKVKLIKYVPHWAYQRNKGLEINCRLARTSDPDLRTQIRLGHLDLELLVKLKGDKRWTTTNIDRFGPIPYLSTRLEPPQEMSPSSPEGRSPKTPKSKTPAADRIKRTSASGQSNGQATGNSNGPTKKPEDPSKRKRSTGPKSGEPKDKETKIDDISFDEPREVLFKPTNEQMDQNMEETTSSEDERTRIVLQISTEGEEI